MLIIKSNFEMLRLLSGCATSCQFVMCVNQDYTLEDFVAGKQSSRLTEKVVNHEGRQVAIDLWIRQIKKD